VLDDEKWVDEFNTTGDEELARAAHEMADGIDDEKLANTEVSLDMETNISIVEGVLLNHETKTKRNDETK
jgi:hypothetical protein